MNDIAVPKSERVWLTHYNANHDPDYVITSKINSRDYYYLYTIHNGTLSKFGRSGSPKDLEQKYVESLSVKRSEKK